MIVWIIVFAIILLVVHILHKKFKFPKVGSMVAVDGGVKSGKTTFSFALAYKTYKRNCRRVKFKNFFCKIFDKPLFEMPLFYSTIPVAFPYVLLTRELLLRKERFAYGSVIFVDEASLFADSLISKTLGADVNDQLLVFNKLIAHELKSGGTIIYNSQQISDLHISIRRCLSETFYVHSTLKWIPFFLIVTLREERFREDGGAVNVYNEDVEEHLKRVIVRKSIWKKFDCYCYSIMTDDLPVNDNIITHVPDLKAREIISFNPRHCFKKEVKELEKHEKKDC